MRDVRKRQEKTDAMFEPLVATVALLKTYGISVQDSVLKHLEARARAALRGVMSLLSLKLPHRLSPRLSQTLTDSLPDFFQTLPQTLSSALVELSSGRL